MAGPDFREIAHCGAQFLVTTKRNEQGERLYSVGIQQTRPFPATIIGLYALQQGIPVGMIRIGGEGAPFNPPPFPGCLTIFVASDSEGRIGHECPHLKCAKYWRSSGAPTAWPITCPYCGLRAPAHQFVTPAQRAYITRCCELITEALDSDADGETSIEFDATADAVAASQTDKPKFYYSEQGQQTQFTCSACGEWNDILGRFGYCSGCGTRNDLSHVQAAVASAHERADRGTDEDLPGFVKDLVSALDTIAQQLAGQLVARVPLTQRRRDSIPQRFHSLRRCSDAFSDAFDIDVLKGVAQEDLTFAIMMFERRHLYEHKGGEVDQEYLDKSGDDSVRLKQVIRETRENVHRLATIVARLGRNLHDGFHELLPPLKKPIELERGRRRYRERQP